MMVARDKIKGRLFALFASAAFFGAAAGCASDELAEAKKLVADGEADCVVIRGKDLQSGRGRGVSPLLAFHDRADTPLRGAAVVDKVIGRAAAAILVSGGAVRVHGLTMSEDGRAYLEAHGIAASFDKLVPRILNADRTGLCPLEQSVLDSETPEAALAALRRRIAELREAAKK